MATHTSELPQIPGLQVSISADPEAQEWLHEQIRAFNDQHSPYHQAVRTTGMDGLAITLHDTEGAIIGGLSADFY